MTEEQKAQILETIGTPGWQLVEKWLSDRDQAVTDAIRRDLLNLKWSEKDKWFAHYSGQASVIDGLRSWIRNAQKPLRKKRLPFDFRH